MCCLAIPTFPVLLVYMQVNAVTKNIAYPEFVFDDAELLRRSKSVSRKIAMLLFFYTLMFCRLMYAH